MRTVIALAVVAAALLGFIVIYERDTVSDGELARRQGRVLPNFIRDRVSQLEISTPRGKVTLVRKPDPEGVMPLGIWHVTKPYQARADGDAVEALLGELEWMDARRRITHLTADDRTRFGLDVPIATVSYRVGRDGGSLSLGGQSPKGDGNYLMTADEQTAFIVGKDLKEALNFAPAHFHTKFLHTGLILGTAKKITVRNSAGTQVVEKRDERWWLNGKSPTYASKPQLQQFVQALDRLLALRVVEMAPSSTKAYGLDPASYSVSILRRTTKVGAKFEDGPDRFEDKTIEFALGAPCLDHEGERYFRVGHGPVVCISEPEFSQAKEATFDLEEHRLAPVVSANIDKVEILQDGKVLELVHKEDRWSYQIVGQGTPVAAEPQTVEGMLTKLVAALPIDNTQMPATHFTGDTKVRLFRKGKVTLELQASTHGDGLRVRRSGETVDRIYPPGLAHYLVASTAEYRSRGANQASPTMLEE